jgi:hypothetical protein
MDGHAVPIHRNGGWECSGPRLDADRERACYRTKCPCCLAPVYFVRHNGGSVWFDELGQPRPIHGCFAKEPATVFLANIRSAAAAIDCYPILGVVFTIKKIGNETGVAVENRQSARNCTCSNHVPLSRPGRPFPVLFTPNSLSAVQVALWRHSILAKSLTTAYVY